MAAEIPEDTFRETTAGTLSPEAKGDQVASPLREPVAREELEVVGQQPQNISRKKPSRFDQRPRVDPLQDNLNVFNNMKPDVSVELGSQAKIVSGEPSDVMEELPSQAPQEQMIRGEPSDVCGKPSQRNTGEVSTNNDTAKSSTSSQGVVARPDNINADTAGEDLSINAFLPAVRKMKEVNPSLNMNGPDVVGPLVESVDQRGLDHYLKEAQEIIRNNPSYKHEEDIFGLESFYFTERATTKYRKPPGSINTDTIQTSLQGIISDREEAGGFDLLASICERQDANNINSTINGDQGPSGIDPTLQSEIPEIEALDSGIPENEAPYSQILENRASAIPDKDAPDDLQTHETSEVPMRGRKRKAPTTGSPGVKLTHLAGTTQLSQERTEEGARAAKKDAKAAKEAAKVANKGRKRETPPSQQNKKKSTPEEKPADETQSTKSESQRKIPSRENKKKYTPESQCTPRSGQEQPVLRRNRQQPAPIDYNELYNVWTNSKLRLSHRLKRMRLGDPKGEEHENNIL